MKKMFFPIAAIITIAVLLTSCSKEGPTGPTGPAGPTGPTGPSDSGSISGHVILFDQYGNRILSHLDSASLTLGGQSVSIHPDATGYFSYAGLTTGEYNITATATGFGSTYTNSFQFLGGNLNRDIKLSAIPTFSITTASAGMGAAYDTLVINCAQDPQTRSFVVFVGSTASVSNATANYLTAFAKNIPANATRVVTLFSADELHNAGLASGATVYFAVYSGAVSDQSSYEDVASGKTVYTAVSNPLTISAIVP